MSWTRSIPPWLWLILVILYFISPVDLIPDVFGLPGRVDDLLVGLAGLYFMGRNTAAANKRAGAAGRRGTGQRTAGEATGGESQGGAQGKEKEREGSDPYKVLGVPRDAPFADVRRRYRERLLEVHPDRVQHLGGEFRELAEKKTRELNDAYRRIEAERGRSP